MNSLLADLLLLPGKDQACSGPTNPAFCCDTGQVEGKVSHPPVRAQVQGQQQLLHTLQLSRGLGRQGLTGCWVGSNGMDRRSPFQVFFQAH